MRSDSLKYRPRVIDAHSERRLQATLSGSGGETLPIKAKVRLDTPIRMKVEAGPRDAESLRRILNTDGLRCEILEMREDEEAGPLQGILITGEGRRVQDALDRLSGRSNPFRVIADEAAQSLRNHLAAKSRIAFGEWSFDFSVKTAIMGILNVTPDSFSDGGLYYDQDAAVERGMEMAGQGADIIDIGGESTRPGSSAIDVAEEKRRVLMVVEALARRIQIPISIDTSKSETANAAVDAGATMINDVSAGDFDPAIRKVAAERGVPYIIMHIRGTPKDMQKDVVYHSLMDEINTRLYGAIEKAMDAGVAREKIIVDPGIGFGKTVRDNLEILGNLGEMRSLGQPILVGPSRKSFIGKTLDIDEPRGRLMGTAAAVAAAVAAGADIVRVHDVAEMRDVLRLADAINAHGHPL